MTDIDHKLLPLGGSPISEDAPCGESVRYEPEFEQLEGELSKLESLKGEPVDWQTVVQLSSEILESKSKDLLVAVYLAQGLLQTEGYRGLAAGLQILSDMVDKYWDTMFPAVKRLRARKVAMEWLAEKASRYIEEKPPADSEGDAVLVAAKLSRELDGDLAEKMEDNAPNLVELTRPMKRFREQFKQQQQQQEQQAAEKQAQPEAAPQAAAEAEPAPVAQEQATAAPPPPPPKPAPAPKPAKAPEPAAAPVDVGSDSDAKKALRQLQDGVRKIGVFYTKSKLSDPKGYRLARTAVWMTIDKLPPNKDSVTQLPPPPADRLKHFNSLFEQSQFSALVPDVEQLVARSAFWLDGHRIVAGCLKSMGAEYAAAHQTVLSELRLFLERVPGVTDLKFSDGTPFADDATRMWIDAEVNAAAGGGGEQTGGAATPWRDGLDEARGLAAKGELDKAVQQLQAGVAQAGTERERFYWRTALAELLIQSGNAAVAIQMLEQMAERIERFQLDEWESELAVPIYRRLLEAYKKLVVPKKNDKAAPKDKGGPDAGLQEKIESVYSRLCWLDPATAITVKGD